RKYAQLPPQTLLLTGLPAQSIPVPRSIRGNQTATRGLANVARDELRHLEHADLALAVENRSERIVGVVLGSLRFVLKTVLFVVVPELFGKLGTRQWF